MVVVDAYMPAARSRSFDRYTWRSGYDPHSVYTDVHGLCEGLAGDTRA
jgi:hypothetical protein